MDVAVARKTRPRMLLTNYTTITVKRYGGDWVNARWVEITSEVFTVEGNVQPLKPTEVMMLAESERTRSWIKVYIRTPGDYPVRTAREGDSGHKPDRIVWEGDEWEVMKAKQYVMGVLDHEVIMCARVPISAL
jgi:hypothetical protein